MNEHINPWTILSGRELYDNPWIRVTEYQVLNPAGGPGIYGKVHFKNRAVGVVPLDDQGNTYLVGQYRFTIDQYSWEIPEGGCPYNEDPLDCAVRELKEETGLVAGSWLKIQDFHLSNSVSDEWGAIFLARDLVQHSAAPEETEQLKIRKLPFEELYQMVLSGAISDAISIMAVLKIKTMMLQGQL